MIHVWSSRWKSEGAASKEHCRAAVHDDFGVSFHQCPRKPKVFRCVEGYEGELGFCAQHDPVAVQARRDKRHEEWRQRNAREREDRAKAEADRRLKEACLEGMRRIAAGHNDPRALALEILGPAD